MSPNQLLAGLLVSSQPAPKQGTIMTWEGFGDYLDSVPLKDGFGSLTTVEKHHLAAAADHWVLLMVDPMSLAVVAATAPSNDYPIIVAPNGDVLDGRRRRQKAIDDGVKAIPAWVGRHDESETLSRSSKPELNAKFRAWFGDSVIKTSWGAPKVMYHGTSRDFRKFEQKQAGSVFLTFDPDFAETFADQSVDWVSQHADQFLTPEQLEKAHLAAVNAIREENKGAPKSSIDGLIKDYKKTDQWLDQLKFLLGVGPIVMPLYVRAEDPFNYENPEHIQTVLGALNLDELPGLDKGSWTVLETPSVQKVIRDLGHDGFWVEEGGVKNLAVYNANQVKSTTGNDGSWSRTNDDITAAEEKSLTVDDCPFRVEDHPIKSGDPVAVCEDLLTKFSGRTPFEINNGECDQFASMFIERLGGSVWSFLFEAPFSHEFIEYQGKFYDAEAPQGVENWWDLPLCVKIIKAENLTGVEQATALAAKKGKPWRKAPIRKLSNGDFDSKNPDITASSDFKVWADLIGSPKKYGFTETEVDILYTAVIDGIGDAGQEFLRELPIERLPISELIPTQAGAEHARGNSDPILVVKKRGQYFVIDGHNRLSAASKRSKTILCRVLLMPEQSMTAQQFAAALGAGNLLESRPGVWHVIFASGSTSDITASLDAALSDSVPLNSLGQPVCAPESVSNFKRWFRRSKVKDGGGRPAVLYHGTPSANVIKEIGFDPKFLGKGVDQFGSGFYFTSDPEMAADITASLNSAKITAEQFSSTDWEEWARSLPVAGHEVDGRLVRDSIPNQSSIRASIENPEILKAVRAVPLSAFDYDPGKPGPQTLNLAAQIEDSGEINPLIVAIDFEGPYILEGSHRFDALIHLRAKELPAQVVLDVDSLSGPQAAFDLGITATDDDLHHQQLVRTGYYGERAAGCAIMAVNSGRFLLPLRSGDVLEPGTYGTWGGAIDKGETPEQAVLREIREETGCKQRVKLSPLLVFKARGFRYYNFLAIVNEEFTPELNWESDGFKWVEFGKWPAPLHPGFVALLKDHTSVELMKQMSGSGHEGNGLPEGALPKVVGKGEPEKSDSRFAYHVTGAENLESIREYGLEIHQPWEGTDQSEWPDGSVEPRVYFASSFESALSFVPERTGRPMMLRLHKDALDLHREQYTGDMYTTQVVPPKLLQFLGGDEAWHPLLEGV